MRLSLYCAGAQQVPIMQPCLGISGNYLLSPQGASDPARREKAAQQAALDGSTVLKALEVTDPVRAIYWQLRQAQLQAIE